MKIMFAGTIRSDTTFWPDFSRRQDDLLKQQGICRRGSDGFLQFSNDGMQVGEYIERNNLLWQQMKEDGYLDAAVEALRQAGYDAWTNSVGDIAIRPSVETA